jgi:hypothetical protein
MKKTKIRGIVRGVFDTLPDDDLHLVNQMVENLDVFKTVTDPVKILHFYLALAATVDEIRAIERGVRDLSSNDHERYSVMLGRLV